MLSLLLSGHSVQSLIKCSAACRPQFPTVVPSCIIQSRDYLPDILYQLVDSRELTFAATKYAYGTYGSSRCRVAHIITSLDKGEALLDTITYSHFRPMTKHIPERQNIQEQALMSYLIKSAVVICAMQCSRDRSSGI